MTKRNELAPCPFCSGKAMIVRGWDMQYGYQVACANFDCFMHHGGAVYESRDKAIDTWNHWIDVARKIVKDMEETVND